MNTILIRPEPAHKSIMYIGWLIVAVLAGSGLAAGIIFVPDMKGKVVFGILGGIFSLIMLLWAVWIPYFYRSLEYAVDDEEVRMNCGVIWKKRVTVPYRKVTNVDITEGPLQRIWGLSTVHVQTAGAGGQQGARAELRLSGIEKGEEIRERIIARLRDRKPAPPQEAPSPRPHTAGTGSQRELLAAIVMELKEIRKSLEKNR